MENDLTDFLHGVALWFFVFRRDFKSLSFTPNFSALRQHMEHMPIIISGKESGSLMFGLLGQPYFFWQTNGGK
jgi:hypothetical protein